MYPYGTMRNALILAAAVFVTGCATVSHGPMQRIRIDADIPDATISAERCGARTAIAKAPATIMVSRRATRCSIRAYAPGQPGQVVHLQRRTANAGDTLEVAGVVLDTADSLGELGIGLLWALPAMLVSSTVDYAAGSIYAQEPSEIHFVFLPQMDETAELPQSEPQLDPQR